jgi:hypothetical protein
MSGGRRSILFAFVACALCIVTPLRVDAAPERPAEFVERPDADVQTQVAAEYGSGFRAVDTAHFRSISESSDRYHRVVSGLLEKFLEQLHERFFDRDFERHTIVLVDDGSEFEAFVARRGFRGFTGNAVFDAAKRSVYARRLLSEGGEAGLDALFREVGRAMVTREFEDRPTPPFWFDESFSSLFEQGRIVLGEWTYGNSSPEHATVLRASLANRAVPTLANLFVVTESEIEESELEPDLYFSVGRSFFLYVLLEHGEKSLREIMTGLVAGTPASEVAGAATGLAPAQLEQAWRGSIRSADLVGDYMNRGQGPTAESVLRLGAELYPGHGNLQVMLASELLRLNKPEDASEHAQMALRDPRFIYPQIAHSVIGRAALLRDDNAAVRSLERAITYQPWIETVMEREYETLARVLRNAGSVERGEAMREALQNLRDSDARETPE